MFRYFLLSFFIFNVFCLQAQETLKASIDEINITGNTKTKDIVILRELPFKKGDTLVIEDIEKKFFIIKKRLLSTGLFNRVDINFNNYNLDKKTLFLNIEVQENWYLYPIVIFELADRNFNVWWNEMNHSLGRVNYGLQLDHINLTGRSDRLKLKYQRGYTYKYELDYDFPSINSNQTLGLRTNIFYSDQKEIPYITEDNKSLFHQDANERKVLYRFRTGMQMYHRPGLFFRQSFKLEYHSNRIEGFVADTLNANYFLEGRSKIKFFLMEYEARVNRQVFDIYPMGGYAYQTNLKLEGLGIFGDINILSLSAKAQKHFCFNEKLFLSNELKLKTNITRDIVPFANNTALGYGDDVITGYEFYVIDGQDYAYLKTQIKFRLFEKNMGINRFMPMGAFKKLNAKVFLRWNTDLGYVNEEFYLGSVSAPNSLNNQFLFGYGPALDLLLYNNFLFKFEYSFNERGEHAFFLKSNNSF